MSHKERLIEARKLMLLAMDHISRVADLAEDEPVGEAAEKMFSSAQKIVNELQRQEGRL